MLIIIKHYWREWEDRPLAIAILHNDDLNQVTTGDARDGRSVGIESWGGRRRFAVSGYGQLAARLFSVGGQVASQAEALRCSISSALTATSRSSS